MRESPTWRSQIIKAGSQLAPPIHTCSSSRSCLSVITAFPASCALSMKDSRSVASGGMPWARRSWGVGGRVDGGRFGWAMQGCVRDDEPCSGGHQ